MKTLHLLFRARAAAAEEALADAHALPILDQQVREAAHGLDRARRALAVAAAQDDAERRRGEADAARAADLEARAVAALAAGREDLATEAAEAIAGLEADRAAGAASRASFAREAARLRAALGAAERRLAAVERGRRAARAAEAVRRLRGTAADPLDPRDGALRDAERTLERLRGRQAEDEAVDAALDLADGGPGPDALSERLEAAGFGPAARASAGAVLERLRAKAAASAAAPTP